MANPQLQRTSFTDLFGTTQLPVLAEIFDSQVAMHPSLRELFFQTKAVTTDIWQYSEVHDMPLFSSQAEGADYSFNRTKQGSNKTLTPVKYTMGFSISEEAIDDGKFDFMGDATRKLAKSAIETQEQSSMDVFNNGFSSVVTADGVALFSASHTTPTGTYTIANTPTTQVDLSFAAMAAHLSNFKKCFRGDSGIYELIMPKYLLVPTELELYAMQIIQSAQEADTNNNNLNPFQNRVQVVSSPHLTDADAHFLISDKIDNGLRIIQRKPIELVMGGKDVGYLNDSVLLKARYREIIGAVKPHGVYGTSGA